MPRRLLWSLDSRDRYNNPGSPLTRALPSGHRVVLMNGDYIYLQGSGSSPQGDRPFLRRFNLQTLKPAHDAALHRRIEDAHPGSFVRCAGD